MSFLSDFFRFSPQKGFLFTSVEFWIFFCLVLGGLSLCYKNRQARNTFLFAASLFFYYKVAGFFVLILLLSVLLNHVIGKRIERNAPGKHAFMFLVGILANIFVLCVFRYNVFFTQVWNALLGTDLTAIDYFSEGFSLAGNTSGSLLPAAIERLMPPVGLSFVTLQAVGYLADLKRGRIRSFASPGDLGFYLIFFPKAVAGPVVRAQEFMPQMQSHYMLTRQEFSAALALILTGLIKKAVVADFLDAYIVSPVFDNPDLFSGLEKWMALYGFSVWIYFAFSGYTDMATGVSSLLGFSLPANFHSPYKASSLTDFWRRWHISLHTWFRDYVYVPLGGNRHGNFRMTLALVLTMLAAGLWYGAGMGFLIWAALHAAVLCVEKASRWNAKVERSRALHLAGWLVTFNMISFSWIFFRSGTLQSAADLFFGLFDLSGFDPVSNLDATYGIAFLLMVLAFVLMVAVRERRKKAWLRAFERWPLVLKFLLTASIATLMVIFRA